MRKGGRYAKKKVKKTPKLKGWKKVLVTVLLTLLVLILALVIAVAAYWNYILGLMPDSDDTTYTTVPTETADAPNIAQTVGEEETTGPTETTSPEDTWPVVVSNENVTNIMVVGQNYREGEEHKLSDTMILCSINRETKTLTMVSFLRDMYVTFPPYAGHGYGANRINVPYNLGWKWTGTTEGGMEYLAQTVEYNFGIHIDHTVEVDFEAFEKIIDTLGGVEVELDEDEVKYLTEDKHSWGEYVVGTNVLDGDSALAYARMRHSSAGDSDVKRTARQRNVISKIIEECKSMGLLDLHKMVTTLMPMITTDMTNAEITNYIFEFLPMLKNLNITSLTCPVSNDILPGSSWPETMDIGGYPSSVTQCNTWLNKQYLTEALGLVESEE